MFHSLLFCSRILVSRLYKYMCVGLIGGQQNSLPSSLLICFFFSSCDFEDHFQQYKLLRCCTGPGLDTNIYLPWTDTAIFLLLTLVSRLPCSAYLRTPWQSLLGLRSLHPDSILLPPPQTLWEHELILLLSPLRGL